jgi:hypothetical protein
MKLDNFTRTLLVVIAALLAIIAFRPMFQPAPVQAQSEQGYPFYVEPGYTTIRKPDGSSQVLGKVFIDMRTGDIWGFPTLAQSPYPIDPTQTKPPKSSPMYLGKFMFDQAKH